MAPDAEGESFSDQGAEEAGAHEHPGVGHQCVHAAHGLDQRGVRGLQPGTGVGQGLGGRDGLGALGRDLSVERSDGPAEIGLGGVVGQHDRVLGDATVGVGGRGWGGRDGGWRRDQFGQHQDGGAA